MAVQESLSLELTNIARQQYGETVAGLMKMKMISLYDYFSFILVRTFWTSSLLSSIP